MFRMAGTAALRMVGDWGLSSLLRLTPEYPYITFDHDRALRDISNNILDNACAGGGTKLDLVFKQAGIEVHEYQALVRMWGPPARVIFCVREPSGYIASAVKKFPYFTLSYLQDAYVGALARYEEIGGDIFEYSDSLTTQHYMDFLSPLIAADSIKEQLRFKGGYDAMSVTDDMWSAYHVFKNRYREKICPYG